ncbi:MAG TPA: hypothetical protein VIM69_09105, partial [Opitutaceae bacterium]
MRFDRLALSLFAFRLYNVIGAAPVDPRFGVCTHFAQGWATSLETSVRDLGISDLRDEIYWQDVEPSDITPGTNHTYQFPYRFRKYIKL